MKRIILLLILIAPISRHAFSQQFEWVNSSPLDYSLNPSLPANFVCVSEAGWMYAAHPDSSSLIYGSDIYGKVGIDCYSTTGALQWSIYLGTHVVISCMIADADGNLFISGSYMQTMSINGTDSLTNTGSGFDTNLFLLCFNQDGGLVWKRNVSLLHPDYYGIPVMAFDPQDNLWYGSSNFFDSEIFKTDASGNDLMSYQLQNGKTLGGISFDPAGNLFVSGATGLPFITVAGLTVAVPESYMMYVTRIDASGVGSWVQLASDVTFQTPQIKADPWGNAYVSGSLFAATTFGTVSFTDPQWLYDVFITRVDKDGNFQWGVQAPQSSAGITGDFERGTHQFMDVDTKGNLFIAGITRGTLDWGNGVISGGGAVSFGTFSVLSFDTSGIALWSLNGGSDSYNQSGSLNVSNAGDCYFSESVTGTATFGALTVNTGGDFATITGKISASVATNISQNSDHFQFDVYPNPAIDFFNLEFSIPATSDLSMELFDIDGRMIRSFSENNLHPGNYSFPFSTTDLRPGTYLLRLQNADGLCEKKIAIQ